MDDLEKAGGERIGNDETPSPTRQPSLDGPHDVEKGPDAEQPAGDGAAGHDFVVKFADGDPANPRNWTTLRKGLITFLLGMLAFSGSLGSSIIAPANSAIAREFNASNEVVTLTIALYVLGFALGPSCWAPVSEVYGRKISILPPVFILALFSIGTARSQNIASVLITRFLGGVFGSAPISNVSAALGDMYAPSQRGIAVTFYAVCVCGGPTLGPIIGAALTVTLGWRWTEYIEAIWVFFVFAIALLFMPEMYANVVLKRRAQRTRKETGDERYHHPHEKEKMQINNIITKYLSRPIRMLFTEPMITAIAIYASFVYGLLYMTLEIFPIVFEEDRGWSPVLGGLPFLGLLVGVCSAVLINLQNQPQYRRAVEANKGRAVPEARLPPMIIGGWLFVIGLFGFGWTANPKIHWAVPTVFTAFIGAGFNSKCKQSVQLPSMRSCGPTLRH